jgi:hypothetical protein
MQKIIYCKGLSYGEVGFDSVNSHIEHGWHVISITPQYCSNSAGGETGRVENLYGGFAVLIEKNPLEI